MTPEGRIVKKALRELRKAGGFWFKIHGSPYQMAGLPDVVGCYRGCFVGLEFKTPDTASDLSPRQRVILSRIKQCGGYTAVCTSTLDALQVTWDIDATLDAR